MRINSYAVVTRAIEDGIERGIQRAYEQLDERPPGQLESIIYAAIMLELGGVVEFGELPSIGSDVPGGGAW